MHTKNKPYAILPDYHFVRFFINTAVTNVTNTNISQFKLDLLHISEGE